MRISTVFSALGLIAIANALPERHGLPQVKARGVYTVSYTEGYGASPTPYADSQPSYNAPPMPAPPMPAPPMSAPPMPASSCQSAMPASNTQYVMVGGSAGLVYTPEYVNANIGDVVIFQFGTKNHTLTQSTFPLPCVKMDAGEDSGFMPTDGTGTLPTFPYTVSVSTPLWFYCRQTGHCSQGMVFAINPPATGPKCFANYKSMALAGGTSTITATSTTSTTVSVYSPPPPPGSPPPAYSPGTNIGTDGQCQCVCNMDVNNGPPNPNQGINWFGGQLGNVQVPWGINAAAPGPGPAPAPGPASAPGPAPAPAPYASNAAPANAPAPAYTTTTGSGPYSTPGTTLGNIQNLGDGTIQPIGDPPSPTGSSSPAATGTSDESDVSDPGNDFGGTAGK